MALWIWNSPSWPTLAYDAAALAAPASAARLALERLVAKAEALAGGDALRAERDVWSGAATATAAIEGESLPLASVRSSVARRLGLPPDEGIAIPRSVEGLLDVLENATAAWHEPLTDARVRRWQASLFPAGGSALRTLAVGQYRSSPEPMQIVSGPVGRETVHYEALPSSAVSAEMAAFLEWFERTRDGALDGVLRAGLAHVWFESIHPFEDGNGRVGRAIVDLALAQALRNPTRLHGISTQIERERDAYYRALNEAQRGSGDVTQWLAWFAGALERACVRSLALVEESLARAKFWAEHSHVALNERQRKALNRMLEAGPGRFDGGLTARKYIGMTGASPATASRDLADLVEKRLLVPGRRRGRSAYYDLAMPGWEWQPERCDRYERGAGEHRGERDERGERRAPSTRADHPPPSDGPLRGRAHREARKAAEAGERGAGPRDDTESGPRQPLRRTAGMVRLRVSVGRRAGVRPGDLVGAIANESGVQVRSIGAIDLADHYSLVQVDESLAERVAAALSRTWLRGQKPEVTLFDPNAAVPMPAAAPPPRAPYRGGRRPEKGGRPAHRGKRPKR